MTKTRGEVDHGARIPKSDLLGLQTQDTMMSGMAAFIVAVGGTSLICYLLMNRVQNRKTVSSSGSSGSGDSSSADGWNLFSWGSSDSSSYGSSSSSDGGGGGGGGGGD
jgi:hypothetical protein